MQCMYNVTLRHVRITIVACKSSMIYSECVSVALAIQQAMRRRHIDMWPAPLYSILRHHLMNGTILGKKLLNIKCVF